MCSNSPIAVLLLTRQIKPHKFLQSTLLWNIDARIRTRLRIIRRTGIIEIVLPVNEGVAVDINAGSFVVEAAESEGVVALDLIGEYFVIVLVVARCGGDGGAEVARRLLLI